jgi:hypothetical protein
MIREQDTICCKTIQMGSADDAIAGATKSIGAPLVEHD